VENVHDELLAINVFDSIKDGKPSDFVRFISYTAKKLAARKEYGKPYFFEKECVCIIFLRRYYPYQVKRVFGLYPLLSRIFIQHP
jgi:hypothetical protein